MKKLLFVLILTAGLSGCIYDNGWHRRAPYDHGYDYDHDVETCEIHVHRSHYRHYRGHHGCCD